MVGSGEETIDDEEITGEIDEDDYGQDVEEKDKPLHRRGKTFKTIPIDTVSTNGTSKIVSISLLEKKDRDELDARALRTYTRLNRTRLVLSTKLPERAQEEALDIIARRNYSIPQRVRTRSTTPTPAATEDLEDANQLKTESTTRRLYSGLNRFKGRISSTTSTNEATSDSPTETTTVSPVRSTRQPYVGVSRKVTSTTTTTTQKSETVIENEVENSENDDAELTTLAPVPGEKEEVENQTEHFPEEPNESQESGGITDGALIDYYNEIPLEVVTSSSTTKTPTTTPISTTSRRQLVIRRRFNGTTTAPAKPEENLDNEIDQNDKESSTLKVPTTTAPSRQQLLIRRRFNTTFATTTQDPSTDNEIYQGEVTPSNTRRPFLSRRRTTTTTSGATNSIEISTRRSYAALNRSHSRFTTPRSIAIDREGDTDRTVDTETEEERVVLPRPGFLQTNRHRALKPISEDEPSSRKPPTFAARRTTPAPTRVSSSTRRNLVAINRNLYHRQEDDEDQEEEEDEESQHDEEEAYDEYDEKGEQEKPSRPTPSSRLSQLLASRQRQPLRTGGTQKPTDLHKKPQETNSDEAEDEDEYDNDEEEEDDSSEVYDGSNNQAGINATTTSNTSTITNSNSTNNLSTALNVASERSNSTVANYLINRFKSNRSFTNSNKPNIKPASQGDEDDTDNDNNNEDDNDASLEKKGENALGNDVNFKRRFQNRYQLSRTRGIGSSTSTSITTQAPSSTNARRLAFGARQRGQVTKLTLVDQQTDETEAKGKPGQTEDSREDQDEEASEDEAAETTTTTTSKPTPKRIRVLKFRRPLNNTNSIALDSLPNSVTDTNTPQTFDTATVTLPPTDTSTSSVNATGTKRFRKVVRKLRPVDSSTPSSAAESNAEETTRKPFIPSNRLRTQSQREQEQEVSDLQRLRDKVKAEQARGEGEQGVINDRLKKLLAEKSEKPHQELPGENEEEKPTSPRPFFKRKLVARRPYTPASGGGAVATTKVPIIFSTTRPTSKFVRRKNGRFDPFNSNVRQRGEGFVRSDPRGARLPGTEHFKSQSGDQDDENEDQEVELKAHHEQPLQNQLGGGVLRRPFVPKGKLSVQLQDHEDSIENSEEEEEDDEEDDSEEDDEDEDETQEKPFDGEEERPKQESNTKPKFNSPLKPKDNRAPPGSRPIFGVTGSGATGPSAIGGGNVPFNPRNRPSSSATNASGPATRFGTTKRPRVVNRPPGVASPNLTIKPVASDYERTTPLTPLKPAPFIPSNTRSYERKYTGPSTEAAETASENSLIEDLNIDALNARNKKIFDIHSKKHTTLKQKVQRPENGAATGSASESELDVESGTEVATVAEDETTEEQGFVTTTPSTPELQPPAPPSTTQSDTQANPATTITPETETETETVPETEPVTETKIETVTEIETETETATNANEATSVNSQDLPSSPPFGSSSSTTQAPPPATTLLHVFTLLEGELEDEAQTTTRKPMPLLHPTRQIEVVPKHKFIEINRIVEINSKQAKASQRKSKANQDFGILRVESLPHVEQLGEISVVKFVHLVDGSDIQINDGHSTVADYTPTEPTLSEALNSPPVRNSLPELPEHERSGKSLLPEVISGALETSTISLEGLFDSARKGKQLSGNSLLSEDGVEGITTSSPEIISDRNTSTTNTLATMVPAYVRPIVPLLRPESNESSPLVISIANLDQVILSKVQKSLNEAEGTPTPTTEITGTATTVAPDSNSAFSLRQHQVVRAPFDRDDRESTTQTTIDRLDKEEVVEQTTNLVIGTTSDSILETTTPKAVPIGAAVVGQLGGAAYTTSETKKVIGSDAISQGKDFGATNASTIPIKNDMENINPNTVTENNNNQTYQTVNGKRVSESVSFSTEERVVHRKKSGRKGRGRRLRNRKTSTTTATPTTTTVETPTSTVDEVFDDTTTMVPE